jgi:hypothetical protein
MKYTFFFFLFITNTLTWAQYLNPNDFPLVTEPIISYKTIDHNSESFLVTLDSTVYHFFRQDPGQTGNHTGNGGRIMMRTSNDNGDTWTNPVVIYDSQYDDRNVHGGITEDGRIIVTFRKYDAFAATHIEYCFMYSDNKGQTWEGPFTLITDGAASGTNQIFGNNIIGYYNSIYSSKYCELRHSWDGSNWDSIVYVWDYRLSNQYKISEASFVYLGNGVIIGLFRNDSGVFGENYFQVESYDYGKTWTEPALTNIAEGFFCPSPWIFFEPIHNDVWVIAIDRRGNFPPLYTHNQDAIWLYKMSPDEIIGDAHDYFPFLVFERPNPSFYRIYGYPASTMTPDGNYLILFTESQYRSFKSEWAFLYQFKILYNYSPISSITPNQTSTPLTIYPNPASEQIFIPLDRTCNNQISIYNELGQLALQTTAPNEFGSNFYNISVESLKSGIYKCVIQTPTENKVATFIKK